MSRIFIAEFLDLLFLCPKQAPPLSCPGPRPSLPPSEVNLFLLNWSIDLATTDAKAYVNGDCNVYISLQLAFCVVWSTLLGNNLLTHFNYKVG